MRVVMTPARAQELLDRNIENNRRISGARVNRYLSDMRAGRWRYNGEAIKVNTLGQLVDGQQRLSAVVALGRPVEMEVIEDLPVGIETSLDQGRSRSSSDALFMRSISHATIVGPTTKLVLNYLEGYNPRAPQTTAAVEDFIAEFPSIVGFAEKCSEVKGVIPPSPLTAVIFLGSADGVRARLADDFITGVATGVGLAEGDPRLALRTTIANNRGRLVGKRSIDTGYAMVAAVRAWNAWCENRSLTATRYSSGRKKGAVNQTPDIRGAPRFGTGVATIRSYINDRERLTK